MNNLPRLDLRKSISALELSVKTSIALGVQRDRHGHRIAPAIDTLGELVSMTESDLLARPGFTRKHLKEIKALLAETWGIGLGNINVPKHEKCIVFGCANHKDEGMFVGDLCGPCHNFITTGQGDVAGSSQIYRNAVDHFTSRLGVAIRVLLFKLMREAIR